MAKKYNWRKYYNRRKKRLVQEAKTAQNKGKNTSKSAKKPVKHEKTMTKAQEYYYARKARLEAEKTGKKAPKTAKVAEKTPTKAETTSRTVVKKIEVKRAGGIATMFYNASGQMIGSQWARTR
jgi:hypothetical protein